VNASELYEIVKDVPREAWPANLHPPTWDKELFTWKHPSLPSVVQAGVPLDIVLPAFVGSMVTWLIPMGNVVYERDGVFMCWNVKTEARAEAPTLIAALAAACKDQQEARP
jgi:hypothetical protein